MAALTPIIGAIATKVRRKLKKAGAFSEDTAKTPKELGVPEKWLRMPGVKKTKDGRYYITCKKKHC